MPDFFQGYLKSVGLPFGNFQEWGFAPDKAIALANLSNERW